MVKLRVMVAMELEGVTEVQPADDDFQHYFTVMCTSCREEHPKVVSFNQKDEREISGSKGTANFVWRCSNCKKEHSASLIPALPSSKSPTPLPYPTASPSNSKSKNQSGADASSYSPFIALDCRGLEFTQYHFRGKWRCIGEESGTHFEFDLDELAAEGGEDEGRWDDYDEKKGEAVGVSDLRARIERM